MNSSSSRFYVFSKLLNPEIMAMYNYLTKEGYDKKMAELEKMKTEDRRAIANDIA